MSQFYERLTPKLAKFIGAQAMFFVATAPVEGRVNLSPKGMDTLRVLDERTVAYADLTGSGIETAAHLRQNGRMTMMFCSFGKTAMILRLYGQGRVVTSRAMEWRKLLKRLPSPVGQRQIIVLDIESAQTSCGYGVPRMDLIGQRDTLVRYWQNKTGKSALKKYWREHNRSSIDGLPSGLVAGDELLSLSDAVASAAGR